MKIFVGGLTARDSRKSVLELVHDLTRGPWYKVFSSPANIKDCRLYHMSNMDDGKVSYSAILEVPSSREAWELIEKLNNHPHGGAMLRAHKWFPRRSLAERRVQYIHASRQPEVRLERRRATDRRQNLRIQTPERVRINPVKGFNRSYGI